MSAVAFVARFPGRGASKRASSPPSARSRQPTKRGDDGHEAAAVSTREPTSHFIASTLLGILCFEAELPSERGVKSPAVPATLWRMRWLATALALSLSFLPRCQAQERSGQDARDNCLESLIDWDALTLMMTATDAQTLDSDYEKVWKHSTATDAAYALKRYKLTPDRFSAALMLAAVPRNRLAAELLYQISYGSRDHAATESLQKALDDLPDVYYYTLGEIIGERRADYGVYLELAALLEGDPGELAADELAKLWGRDSKGLDAAVAKLDVRTRRRICSILEMEQEPWLKDKRIRSLCPDQRTVIEGQAGPAE